MSEMATQRIGGFSILLCWLLLPGCEDAPDLEAQRKKEIRAGAAEHVRHAMPPPEPWCLLRNTVEFYVKNFPDRPIIVAIGAHWCPAGFLSWRTLFKKEAELLLRKHNFLCLVGDNTHRTQFIESELQIYGDGSLPLTILYDHKRKTWEKMPPFFTQEQLEDTITRLYPAPDG